MALTETAWTTIIITSIGAVGVIIGAIIGVGGQLLGNHFNHKNNIKKIEKEISYKFTFEKKTDYYSTLLKALIKIAEQSKHYREITRGNAKMKMKEAREGQKKIINLLGKFKHDGVLFFSQKLGPKIFDALDESTKEIAKLGPKKSDKEWKEMMENFGKSEEKRYYDLHKDVSKIIKEDLRLP